MTRLQDQPTIPGREWRISETGERYLVLRQQEFGGVYQIVNRITGTVYVGISHEINSRFVSHMQVLLRGKHGNGSLQAEFTQCGSNAYVLEIIQLCPPEQRPLLESELIRTLILGGAKVHNSCSISKAARRELIEQGAPECWPPTMDVFPFSRVNADDYAQGLVHGARPLGEEGHDFPPPHVLTVLKSAYAGRSIESYGNRPYADQSNTTIKAVRKIR